MNPGVKNSINNSHTRQLFGLALTFVLYFYWGMAIHWFLPFFFCEVVWTISCLGVQKIAPQFLLFILL